MGDNECGESKKCAHAVCGAFNALEDYARVKADECEALGVFSDRFGEFYGDVMHLVELAGMLAIQLEGDKDGEDDRLEARVLAHIEEMGMGGVLAQAVCVNAPHSNSCDACGWEPPDPPEEEKH